MLCGINPDLVEDARRILTLLCFSERPLTVLELIEGLAIEIDTASLNDERRLQDADDIHEICPGLINVDLIPNHSTGIKNETKPTQVVRIAHFSVQEYLESGRIQNSKAAKFGLNNKIGHAEIAQVCLIYLLEPCLYNTEFDKKCSSDHPATTHSDSDESILLRYPLAHFAATYWYHHYKSTEGPIISLNDLISKLFQRSDSFLTCIKLYDQDQPLRKTINLDLTWDSIASPVYYAALLGIFHVLYDLTNTNQQEISAVHALPLTNITKVMNVNAQGGRYGNALQAASSGGHEKIVQLLIEKGADVNAQGGRYGNALQAASYGGHEKIARQTGQV